MPVLRHLLQKKKRQTIDNMLKIGTSIVAFLLFLCLLYADWVAARAAPHGFPSLAQLRDWRALVEPLTNSSRLRMVAVTHNELIAGEPIESTQFDWYPAWVPECGDFITQPRLLAGMFAFTDLPTGKTLHLKDISRDVPGFEIPGRLNVPIAIEAQIASKLKPGMRLALVNSNSFLLLESALTNGPSFCVLSVHHEGTEPTSGVVVSVPADHIGVLTNLVNSQWRPIIMPSHR
jgi:hypothetical protein